MLNGQSLGLTDVLGNAVVDDTFLLLLNAHHDAVDFKLPAAPLGGAWKCLLNTSRSNAEFKFPPAGKRMRLKGRSLALLSEPVRKGQPL